jgi:hypothetical protein
VPGKTFRTPFSVLPHRVCPSSDPPPAFVARERDLALVAWHPVDSAHHTAMVRLAANLSFLFKERPFLDRFQAAAAAGFRAVRTRPSSLPQRLPQHCRAH